ncbi:uncharacterized protein LOC8056266 isoform X1 [Sorghum bicolor]|nr:uncharacterized protein LOC8056266 isoform X1 [Sorghum bicolor]|eukprot:XP_021315072.1 uncharacterized protein LOC8056266 isoform X1 [Sorghum bicolor]
MKGKMATRLLGQPQKKGREREPRAAAGQPRMMMCPGLSGPAHGPSSLLPILPAGRRRLIGNSALPHLVAVQVQSARPRPRRRSLRVNPTGPIVARLRELLSRSVPLLKRPSPLPAHGDLAAPAQWRRPPHPRQGEAAPRPQLAAAGSCGARPPHKPRRSYCPELPRSLCQALLPPANLGAGVQLHNGDDLTYSLRAKKAVLFRPDNGFLGLNLKGRLLIDKEFKPTKTSGAVELAWTILDFKQGQDVRLKVGYELDDKVPYFQLRENSWTLNAYMDGKWDVRFEM